MNVFLGVAGYQPSKCTSVDEVRRALGEHALVGSSFDGISFAWDVCANDWWADAPVILHVGERQVEVAAYREFLCVSVDEIDPVNGLDWYGAGADLRLEWRRNPTKIHALTPLLGAEVTRLGAGVWHATEESSALHSLEVELSRGRIALENGGDELALRVGSPAPKQGQLHVSWLRTASSSE